MPAAIPGSRPTRGAVEPMDPTCDDLAPHNLEKPRQTTPAAILGGLTAPARPEVGNEVRAMSEVLGAIFSYQEPRLRSQQRRHEPAKEALRLSVLASALPALPPDLRPAVAQHLFREIDELPPQYDAGPLNALLAAGLIEAPATTIQGAHKTLSELAPEDRATMMGAIASASAMRQLLREPDASSSPAYPASRPGLPKLVETLFGGPAAASSDLNAAPQLTALKEPFDSRASSTRYLRRHRVAASEAQRLIEDILDMGPQCDAGSLHQLGPRLNDKSIIEPVIDAIPKLAPHNQHALLKILVPKCFTVDEIESGKKADLVNATIKLIEQMQREELLEDPKPLLAHLVGDEVFISLKLDKSLKSTDRMSLVRRLFNVVLEEQPEDSDLFCAFLTNVYGRLPPSGQDYFHGKIKELINNSTPEYVAKLWPVLESTLNKAALRFASPHRTSEAAPPSALLTPR